MCKKIGVLTAAMLLGTAAAMPVGIIGNEVFAAETEIRMMDVSDIGENDTNTETSAEERSDVGEDVASTETNTEEKSDGGGSGTNTETDPVRDPESRENVDYIEIETVGLPDGGEMTDRTAKTGLCETEDGELCYYERGKRVTDALRETDQGIYYFNTMGNAVRRKWKMIAGKRYYFKKSGQAAIGSCRIKKKYYIFDKNGQLFNPGKLSVVSVNKKRYLVNRKGLAVKGWRYINGKVYYANKTGACAVNRKVGYIRFNKKACAKNKYQAIAKMLARKFINRHCSKKMSRKQKFKKCFRYIMAYTNYVPRTIQPKSNEKNWQYRAAISMFESDLTGNCYGIASAVSAVAKELGYQPYEIWAAEDHAFVIIDGKYYDNMHGAVFGASTHAKYTLKQKFKF